MAQRIMKELKNIQKDLPLNCTTIRATEDMFKWNVVIKGPKGPYQHGLFSLEIRFPQDYPFQPPRIKFLTKIYHCNITINGIFDLDIWTEWCPTMSTSTILLLLDSLLMHPNADVKMIEPSTSNYIFDQHSEQDRFCYPQNSAAIKYYQYSRYLYNIQAHEYARTYAKAPKQSNYDIKQRFFGIKNCLLEIVKEITIVYIVLYFDGLHIHLLPMQARKNLGHRCILNVKYSTGKVLQIQCSLQQPLIDLKYEIEKKEGIPSEKQIIMSQEYAFILYDDKKPLMQYGIHNHSELSLIVKQH